MEETGVELVVGTSEHFLVGYKLYKLKVRCCPHTFTLHLRGVALAKSSPTPSGYENNDNIYSFLISIEGLEYSRHILNHLWEIMVRSWESRLGPKM